jgi:hypothetical protein
MLLGLAQCDRAQCDRAQCEDRDRLFRPLYVAAIVLIQLYTLPVADVIERLASS